VGESRPVSADMLGLDVRFLRAESDERRAGKSIAEVGDGVAAHDDRVVSTESWTLSATDG